jgi:hypothetical protein
MTREEAKMLLNNPKNDSDKIVDQIYDAFDLQEEDNETRIEQLEEQVNKKVVPAGPTVEEERKIWPSLQADNLHDAEKWRYLEEISDKCNLNTIRQIFKEHVSGTV